VEALEKGDGDEDNDSLLAVADLNLLCEVRMPTSKMWCANKVQVSQIPVETTSE
jgi:hypothetical protein